MQNANGVETNARWGGFANLFGSEGGFMIHASGEGQILVGCYGALESWDLGPNDMITVDTGHMVAYQETVRMTLEELGQKVNQLAEDLASQDAQAFLNHSQFLKEKFKPVNRIT